MNSTLKIVALADACVGYGSPQIPAFVRSLIKHYGAEGIILEPDDWGKPPKHELFPDLTVKRMLSDFHPYTSPGRIDYNLKTAKELEMLQPDILVVFCTFCLPALLKIRFKPKFTIYYSIESIVSYGKFDIEMNRFANRLFDLIVFPEENRAVKDGERCDLFIIPIAIIYNSSDFLVHDNPVVPPDERNGRILHSGTIASEYTFADYYLEKKMQRVPIDLFGPIEGNNKVYLEEHFSNLSGAVRYRGHVEARTLAQTRKKYSYSLAIWTPISERGFYAPSNKFFESILDGVPPITAPHPQHKMIVDRYHCGLVMEDWSFDAFYDTIQRALKIYGTPYYHEMVENCRKAVVQELSWDKQFEKVKRFLKEVK